MIKIDNLKIGKRYWLNTAKNTSGIFRGRLNLGVELEYNEFNNIIKIKSHENGYYIEVDGTIGFECEEHQSFSECKIIYKQLELTF